ncbi:ROK family glucokinase [Bacillus sp. AGMB 02131]|uniref:Glucokinase n=1 Tax=Peribacillus faecalis TaxID=2772559 RepID=A0A927CYN2_9BACI|nr:ROK family glucokinase [Peribacillus faecalis]MBD3108135.1 ROK family glucokinase [Peribacillus faecalis]
MEKWLVGIDLGGTTVKMAFIDFDGAIQHKWEIKTDTSNQGENILKNIADAIQTKLVEAGKKKDDLIGIGIGAPGPINPLNGNVFEAVNLGWKDYPLQEKLSEATQLPVYVENDANIAALGEMWKGAGEGAKDLVCFTLGTGIGGGVIVNGLLVQGVSGAAGEIGHLPVVLHNGYACNCGKTGCLETVASATGIVRLAMEEIEQYPNSLLSKIYKETGALTAKDVADSAREGDEYAKKVMDRVSSYLGLAVANVANVLNPEKIIIGGGVSRAGSILLDYVETYYEKYAFIRVKKSTQLALATLGNDAGVIGAAWLVKSSLVK